VCNHLSLAHFGGSQLVAQSYQDSLRKGGYMGTVVIVLGNLGLLAFTVLLIRRFDPEWRDSPTK
jgi:hypothetical protein